MGLGTKLAASVAVLVALATLATSAAGLVSTRSQVGSDIDRFLQERASEILSGDRAQPTERDGKPGRSGNQGDNRDRDQDQDEASLDDALELANGPQAVDADAEVQILDQTGSVISSIGIALPVDDTDRSLAERDDRDVIRTVTVDNTNYRMLTTHISGGGAIQIARSLDGTTKLLSGIQQRVLVIGFICSLLAAGAGLLLARRTTEPLRQLTTTVEEVTQTRDLSTSIDLDRTDEIGRLADSFDTMLRALSDSRRQQHRLVQDAAHELRTPLTSMKANVDLLVHAPDLDVATRNETIEGIRSELTQLQLMFTEIIELATDTQEQVEHQPVELAEVVHSAVASFATRHANPIDVDVDSSVVLADRSGLERAVGNLLGNAEKFAPALSPIGVRLHQGVVSVSDTGPGIAPGEESRIFDRFYRSVTTQALPGSGLGLAIVEKIVSDHGGSVFARNEGSGGATIGFSLPPL